MFKTAFKLLAVTVVLTAAFSLLSGGHAAAATTSCPSGDSVPSDWGNDSDGEGAGVMASLVLRARDESGNPLNPGVTLQSEVPGDPADNAQIFQWPIGSGGRTDNTSTWGSPPGSDQKDFKLGAHMSGDGGISCNGWLVFGPGTDGHVGNGWVLNCHAGSPSDFWISHLDNPNGAAGRWEMLNSSGQSVVSDVNQNGANFKFYVHNGTNERYTFVWHPDAPQPQPGPSSQTLQYGCTGVTETFRHVNGYRSVVKVSGTTGDTPPNGDPYAQNPDGSYIYGYVVPYVGTMPGQTGTYDSRTISYTAQAQHVYLNVITQKWNGSSWVDDSSVPFDFPCYHATCSTPTVDGDGPGNIVLAGHQYTVNIPVTNDNTSYYKTTIPAQAGNNKFSLTEPPENGSAGFTEHDTGFSLDPGATNTAHATFTAPNQVQNYTLSFYPDFYGYGSLGTGCAVTFPIYQQFSDSVKASSILNPTSENPTSDTYNTSITVYQGSGQSVTVPVTSQFYKLSATGVKTPLSTGNIDGKTGNKSGSGPWPASAGGTTSTVLSGTYAIPGGSYQAGDEFCATIHADYTGGYVGPGGAVAFTSGGADDSSCPRVANEPYFKVYGGDISAGGEFDKCTTDGGTLAGYANVSDPSGLFRGSSTQLSALALLKITGVASARGSGSTSPTGLTFANNGVQVDSSGTESPVLGGSFGGCRQLTDIDPPTSTLNLSTSSLGIFALSAANGAYTRSGDLSIAGGVLPTGHNVSVFVDGNVYIGNNISYGTGWSAGSAPSFIVRATGNIYIDPSVTSLAGLYIAKSKSSGGTTTGGKIYTCADSSKKFSPVAAANLYNTCNKQLVVYGGFVADQVNLMRTFGSLRDEAPGPGTPAQPGTTNGLVWSCGGDGCNPSLSGMSCVATNEPYDSKGTWQDNQLCWPATSDKTVNTGTSTLKLAWTHWSDSTFNDPYKDPARADPGNLSLSYWQSHGYPYCTPWNVSDPDSWDDNYLCSNVDKKFKLETSDKSSSSRECVKIYEPADADGQWTSGYYLCGDITPATPAGPATPTGPPFTACSNRGSQLITQTCAGEVFEYNPGIYMSNPAQQPKGGGSLQYQSLTSLPPVL